MDNSSIRIKTSFQKKILLSILPITFMAFAIVMLIVYTIYDKHTREMALDQTMHITNRYTTQIEKRLMEYLAVARSYNLMISKFETIDIDSRRQYYFDLTGDFAKNNENIMAFWLDFDPNTFDGKDAQYANVPPYASKGRYNISWNRSKGYAEPDADFEIEHELDEDYYVLPKKEKKEVVLNPYYYSYSDKPEDEIIETSICIPIFSKNGEVIGVTGIDISLETVKEYVDNIKPFHSSYAMLISSDGLIVSYPDTTMLGKSVLNDNRYKSMMDKVALGEEFYLDIYSAVSQEQSLAIFTPIQIGQAKNIMFLGIAVPYSTIFEKNNQMLKTLSIWLAALMIVISITIIIISKKFAKPIMLLNMETNKLARGELDLNVNIKSKDETGAMAQTILHVADTLKSLTIDINKLTNAAAQGNLNVRGDANKYSGSYQQLIIGVNTLLDEITMPINIAASYLEQISKGNIPPKISERYQGDFEQIKNNLNTCIDAIELLTKDTYKLVQHALVGRVLSRADVSKHSGDYKRIVAGINELLDLIVVPEQNSEYFNRISVNHADTTMLLEIEKMLVHIHQINEEMQRNELGLTVASPQFQQLLGLARKEFETELYANFENISQYTIHIFGLFSQVLNEVIIILTIIETNNLPTRMLEELRKELKEIQSITDIIAIKSKESMN